MRDYGLTQRLYDRSGGNRRTVRSTSFAVNFNLEAEAGGKVTLVQKPACVKRGQKGASIRYKLNSC